MTQQLYLTVALVCLCLVIHGVLGLATSSRSSRFDGSSLVRKRVGPHHIDASRLVRGTTDSEEGSLGIRRSTRATFPVFHLPLYDSDPYGLINYAESVVFIIIYSVNESTPTRTRLYRGTLYGVQIENITGWLDPSDVTPLLSTNFYVSDDDPNIVAFPHATLGQMYLSHDRGLTFDKVIFTPSTIDTSTLSWYPMDHDWVLGQDILNKKLYISTDTGLSWTLVANNVATFAWGDPSIDPPHTVYYSVYDSVITGGEQTVRLYSQQPPFSPQPRLEFDSTLGPFNSFTLAGHYIIAESVTSTGDHIAYVSYKRKQFQMTNFPSTHIHRYQFYDANNVQMLALLEDESGQLNLYISDLTGVNYILSLEDLVYDSYYSIDFDEVYGVSGTFVANQYVRSGPSQATSAIRTVITFNNGALWSPIRAPRVDYRGYAIACSFPECSLHLFMDTSEYYTVGVYSHLSAPGLIAAHGTFGQYQGSSPDLYMSRDGGMTWFQALPYSWNVAFLDHGGVIVATQDYHQLAVGYLVYSTDEGLTWQSFRFASKNVLIFGVITDPFEVTADVCLFGIEDSTRSWVVWNVDFQSVFPRQCVQSDYYTWNTGCRLGNQLSIQRRLNNASCLNGPSYRPNKSSSICSCALVDYQCAFGYRMPKYPTSPAGSCTNDTAVTSSQVTTGSGYQKIPGDVCLGYFNVPVESAAAAAAANSSTVAAAVSVTVILVILITAIVVLLGLFALFRVKKRRTMTTTAASHGSAEPGATYTERSESITITSDSFVVNGDTQKIMEDVSS